MNKKFLILSILILFTSAVYSQQMDENGVYLQAEKMPVIKGGMREIGRKIQYPSIAKEMGIAVKDLTPDMVKQIETDIELRDSLEKTLALYQGIAATIETGIVDALEGAINGTRTLGDVARSVFGSIQRQLLDFGVNALLQSIPGFGSFFKRANGGPVSAGQSYMVGERGAEMFVPNAGGRIVPNEDLTGGSTNIVVNVDASGSSVEGDKQEGQALGLALSAAIETELIKQKRPGGLLA